MKQRLGIAAALLGDPTLLILDEPANGLDPQGVREMRALIGGLAGTRPHGARVVARPQRARAGVRLAGADRHRPIAVPGPHRELLDGAVGGLAVDAAARRATSTRSARAARRAAACARRAPRAIASWSASTTRDVGDLAAAVNRAAFDAGIVLVELSPLRTTLEDRYLALVKAGAR